MLDVFVYTKLISFNLNSIILFFYFNMVCLRHYECKKKCEYITNCILNTLIIGTTS